MGVAAIRAAAAAVLDGVPALAEVLAYPPDNVGPIPCAWFNEARAVVTMGASEVWEWTLPLTVVVARKAVYGQELAAVEALIDDLMTAIRANYTLNGLTYGLNLVAAREGTVGIAGVDHVGFTLEFRVKEKSARTLGG